MFQEIKGPIIYFTFGRSLSSWNLKKLYSIAHEPAFYIMTIMTFAKRGCLDRLYKGSVWSYK